MKEAAEKDGACTEEEAEILALLAAARGVDFRDYRQETLARRIAVRIAATGCRDARAYLAFLEGREDELGRLLEALLVRVTSFFRDPPAFEALRDRVVPELAAAALGREVPIRAWVVGAATGEEAYSLAMLLEDGLAGRDFEVLGSDVDAPAVEIAAEGRFPCAAAAAVPEALAARFLDPAPDGMRVKERLKRRVRFALHDVVGPRHAPREAIVASFDLILCRNLLIYFTRRLQERALERLAGALVPWGVLVLGPAESLPEGAERRFRAIDENLNIYRRRDEP